MTFVLLSLVGFSFLISVCLTATMIRLAPRIGFVDKPGHRKIHSNPKPLGGGVGIFAGVVLPLLAVLAAASLVKEGGAYTPYLGGVRKQAGLALAIVLALLAM